MKKTPIVFLMDYERNALTDQVRPGCEWVAEGEGTATIKFDGSACLWKEGRLWKRYDRKLNKAAQRRLDAGMDLGDVREELFKVPPDGFEACADAPDPVTFHWPGWVPVSGDKPEDKWHIQALEGRDVSLDEGQTYELVGPSLGLNPYGLERHQLWRHGQEVVDVPDRSHAGLKRVLEGCNAEGLVFHHPDGRMAKIRRKDFGLFWVQEDTRAPKRARRPLG